MVSQEDLIAAREEIARRKSKISELRVPVITRRELQLGMKSRPRRLEIKRYKKEILAQKLAYENQLRKIDEYLESSEKNYNGEIEIFKELVPKPRISLFHIPKLKKVRKIRRMRWLR